MIYPFKMNINHYWNLLKESLPNPKEHSGEGIFFSCRACDLFLIHSGSLTYSLDRASDIGKFIETDKDLEDNNFSVTLVLMAMNNNSSNSLKKVF